MKYLRLCMITSKVSKKGQIVLPKELREKLNLSTGDLIVFREEGGKIILEVLHESLIQVLESCKPFEKSTKYQQKLREEWE